MESVDREVDAELPVDEAEAIEAWMSSDVDREECEVESESSETSDTRVGSSEGGEGA